MERGAFGSELDSNPAERRGDLEPRGFPLSGRLHGQHTLSSPTTVWYADFKVYPTVVPGMTL